MGAIELKLGYFIIFVFYNIYGMMFKKETICFLYGAIAILLLLCLLHMPYGFYTFVRFIATIAFCFIAYVESRSGNRNLMFLFIVLAILFQPIFRIPIGRTIWNIVDVLVAAVLLYILVKRLK